LVFESAGQHIALALAAGGTIFLDEIGDLPTQLQVMLLRLLKEQRLQRGGKEELESDARPIVATNPISKPESQKEFFGTDFMLGRLNGSPAATTLKEAGENLEREMVQQTLKLHSERSVRFQGNEQSAGQLFTS
jgi:DNA-binding NtrC family response regulator